MPEQNKSIQMIMVEGETKHLLKPITDAKNVKVTGENLPTGTSNVEDVMHSLGALAFEDGIEIPEASTEGYGLVLLSDDYDDPYAMTNTAATTKAVSNVSAESVKVSGDQTIEGMKTFKDGLTIGKAKLTYTESIEDGVDELTLDFID